MSNRWVEHVKEFARKNNMSYGCALSDPNLKKGYVPTGDKKRKPEKLKMATPSTEPKPKNIVIQPRPKPTPAPAQEDKTWTDRFKVGDEVLYTYPNSSTRYLAIVRKKTPKSVSIQLDDYDEEGQLLLWKRKFDMKKEVVKSEVRLKKKGDEMNTYSTSSDKDLLFKRGYMSRSDPNA